MDYADTLGFVSSTMKPKSKPTCVTQGFGRVLIASHLVSNTKVETSDFDIAV